MKRGTWIVVLLTLTVLAGIVGCSSSRESENRTASTPSSSIAQPAPTPVPAATPTSSAPAAAPIEVAIPPSATEASPGSVEIDVDVTLPSLEGIFANTAAALAALQSYRYTTTFTFVGAEDGAMESGSIEVRGAVASADRQQMTWTDLSDGSQFGLVRVGDRAWILDEEEWSEVPTLVADAASQAVLIYAPAMSWGGFAEGLKTTSTYVGEEVVNGIPSRHYASTYRAWAMIWQGEVTDASADVWIAEAGYPVRYRFSASGVDEAGNRGAVTWTMDLTDVNTPISIELPQ